MARKRRKLLALMATIRQRAPILSGRGSVSSTTTVNPLPPVFTVSPTSATYQSTALPQALQFTATDPNGDTVSYAFVSQPSGYSIDSSSGLVTVAAGATSQSFKVRATDAIGLYTDSATCAVTVAVIAEQALVTSTFDTQSFTGWANGNHGNPLVASATHTRSGAYSAKAYLSGLTSATKYRTQMATQFGVINPAWRFLPRGQINWVGFSTFFPTQGSEPGATWAVPQTGFCSIFDFKSENELISGSILSWNIQDAYHASQAGQPPVGHFAVDAGGVGKPAIWDAGAYAFGTWTDWVIQIVPNSDPINTGTNIYNAAKSFDDPTYLCGRMRVWRDGTLIKQHNGPWQNIVSPDTGMYMKLGCYLDWPGSWVYQNETTYYWDTDLAKGLTDRVCYYDQFRWWLGGADGYSIVAPR